MSLHSDRIRQLREKAGKSEGEMAEIMNISVESYFDLEAYDDEVLDCISLDELKKMSSAFGVSSVELLTGVPETESKLNHITYGELVKRIKKHIKPVA
jgi:ribosome-binding protein aMBF1 (putative translation factor)